MVNSRLKTWRIFLILINYYLGYLFLYPFLISFITLLINPAATEIPFILEASVYFFMLLVNLILAKPLLDDSIAGIKKEGFFQRSFKYLGLMYAANILFSILTVIFIGDVNRTNQTAITVSYLERPLFTFFVSAIYAPIVEEIVFRGAVFKSCRCRLSFLSSALISGLLFGLIHVFSALLSGEIIELWFLILYAAMGIVLCHAYEKSNSIFGSIFVHFLNNALATLLLLI